MDLIIAFCGNTYLDVGKRELFSNNNILENNVMMGRPPRKAENATRKSLNGNYLKF